MIPPDQQLQNERIEESIKFSYHFCTPTPIGQMCLNMEKNKKPTISFVMGPVEATMSQEMTDKFINDLIIMDSHCH